LDPLRDGLDPLAVLDDFDFRLPPACLEPLRDGLDPLAVLDDLDFRLPPACLDPLRDGLELLDFLDDFELRIPRLPPVWTAPISTLVLSAFGISTFDSLSHIIEIYK
jgi:hypothetical protein